MTTVSLRSSLRSGVVPKLVYEIEEVDSEEETVDKGDEIKESKKGVGGSERTISEEK